MEGSKSSEEVHTCVEEYEEQGIIIESSRDLL